MRRCVRVLMVVLVLGLLGGAAVAQTAGGELIAGISADPIGLDPHKTSAYSSFEVLENVYDTLVGITADLRPEPALAERWETSEDGLTWTFFLRPGVSFHNGRALVAADVAYSLNRIMDPETGSGASWRLASVEDIQALDDRTVVIRLKHPYPGLLTKVGGYKGMAIVAKENVEDGSISTHPIGTGPFAFSQYVPGDRIVLVKNEAYWQEGKPFLDRVVFRVIPDETVRVTSLLTGEIDWMDSVPPQQVATLSQRDDVEVEETSGTAYWYIGVNLNYGPYADVRVRRALAMAIDREEIAAAAKWEAAVSNDSPIPDGAYYDAGVHPFREGANLDEARQLLAEAGYPDGFTSDVMVSNFYPETVRAALTLQSQLSVLGIELEIRVLEWGTWLDEEAAGHFDLFICGWIGNLDPDDYFYAQHYTGESFNFTGYANPELDLLLDRGRMATDAEERYAIYSQVQDIVINDVPYIYLYIPKVVHAWQPHVHGYVTRADEAIRFVDTWIEQ